MSDSYWCALGGCDRNECLLSVERLQSLNPKWKFVAPMFTRRSNVAALSLNGSIYAKVGPLAALKSQKSYEPI